MRRPMRRAVASECYALIDRVRAGEVAGARAAWDLLAGGWLAGPDAQRLPIGDIDLLCWTGWTIAMAEGEYERAVSMAAHVIGHPQAARLDPAALRLRRMDYARALLAMGRAEEGITQLRQLIASAPSGQVLAAVRGAARCLATGAMAHDTASAAPTALVALTVELERRLLRRRLERQVVGATYSECVSWLEAGIEVEHRRIARAAERRTQS